jgi:hypothetical protein
MEFVQYKETQSAGRGDQFFALSGPREHQLGHYVVGEQDVWRVRHDATPVVLFLLPSVAFESDHIRGAADKFVKLIPLTVG